MIPFKPTIEPNLDGAFITEHPLEIIKSGKAADVPFLTGITTEDGALKSAGSYWRDILIGNVTLTIYYIQVTITTPSG